MDWPPQNTDLNIVETVWDHLSRGRYERQSKSKEQLKEAWYTIPEDDFKKLQESPQNKMCFMP